MILAIRTSWRSHSVLLWVPLFLIISVLAVPLSSTAKSIFMPLALVSILLAPAYRQDLLATLYQPWCQAAFLFVVIASIACLWSPATLNERMLVLGKYVKLLYLPILAVGFREARTRQMGFHAFLAAMVITCIISILHARGFVSLQEGHVIHNHIITGHMMAFATYFSALFFIRQRGKLRWLYASLVLLFTYQLLFLSEGRTGYVVYLLLMMLLIAQTLPWRRALVAMFLGCALFVVNYYQNPVMHARVADVITNVQQYQHNQKDTSVGTRLQFHQYAKGLFLSHPWLGNGTGSFTHLFEQDKPVPAWITKLLEPHSQYWLIASESGLLGILALLLFLGSLFVASLHLHAMRPIAMALLLPFLIGNLSDSLLLYSGSGCFFLIFMALCLGEQFELNPKKKL